MGLIKDIDRKLMSNHMNPYDKWFIENTELKNKMDSYYNEQIKRLYSTDIISSALCEDISTLYEEGTVGEKTQVITVLSTIELFWF